MNFKLWLESSKKHDISDVESYAKKLGLKFDSIVKKYGEKALVDGVNTEFEHKTKDKKTNVIGNHPEKTLAIALAHLDENPDYYRILKKIEKQSNA